MNYEKETIKNRRTVIVIMVLLAALSLFVLYTVHTVLVEPLRYKFIMVDGNIVPVYEIEKDK